MLNRALEPEVMDAPTEAIAYDRMDHAAVNRQLVDDLLAVAAGGDWSGPLLDLGTGTAQIPIVLCRQVPEARLTAVDLSPAMLDLARQNIARAEYQDRIAVEQIDAKRLPFDDGRFTVVISNSLVHHVADPLPVLAEAARVAAAGGLLFFRDLLRPPDDAAVKRLVRQYAGDADPAQRKMFDDSLRAALDLYEIRELVRQTGFDPKTVSTTSDRHWTWTARCRSELSQSSARTQPNEFRSTSADDT